MREKTSRWMQNGMQCLQQNRFQEAEAAFRQVLAERPSHAPAQHLLGLVYLQCGLLDAAAELLCMAVANDGRQAAYQANLAVALKKLGERELQQASTATGSEAHVQVADSYFARALRHVDKAVRLQPDFANAHFNRGKLLSQRGEMEQALQAMNRVVKIKPQTHEAWNEIGGILLKTGNLPGAREAWMRAADCPRDGHKAYSNYLLSMNYDMSNAEAMYRAHREWEARYTDPAAVFPQHANRRDPERRLKIGYVSADFHFHSVAYFVTPVIEGHSRERFEVYGYSDSTQDDAMGRRIRQATDAWCDTRSMDDVELADRIREDGIDVLVDLAGHTSDNRLRMFALRPAPVQLTWIGYPNTTGLSAMDYRITDAVADPPGEEAFYSEHLVRLPGGFLAYSPPDVALSDTDTARQAGSGNHAGLRLGCFNILAKLSDDCVQVWAEILKQLPGATLVIKNISMIDKQARARLIDRFRRHGVEAKRLDLVGWLASRRAHYDLYRGLDLALDTFPYNGTTTTCEALCMGVPVAVLNGSAHAGRVGASLLHRVGLDELVADSGEAYVRQVVKLAGDPAGLARLREGLAGRAREQLCDAPRLVDEFEAACRKMWRVWCMQSGSDFS